MWRAAARGWCDLVESRSGCGLSFIPSNHPSRAPGRDFPSLAKEGSIIAEFRDRNYSGLSLVSTPVSSNFPTWLAPKNKAEKEIRCPARGTAILDPLGTISVYVTLKSEYSLLAT